MAAQWANYPVMSFFDLPGEQQSIILAAYQVSMQIQAVLAYQQERDAMTNAKKKSGSSPRRRR